MRILCVFFILTLSGCALIPSSPTPHFYMLHPADKDNAGQKFTIPSDVIIGLGPVNIPEYQNRPQIVTKNKNKTLKFSEFNRWGERLDRALVYVISEDLAAMLSDAAVKAHPWNQSIPVKYQVIIDVVQLESELDNDLVFVAQWSIINTQNKHMMFMKRSEFSQPINPHSYSGLVETFNKVCVSLAGEIAQALASIAAKDEVKKT